MSKSENCKICQILFFKKSPKFKTNLTDPILGAGVSTTPIYCLCEFPVNPVKMMCIISHLNLGELQNRPKFLLSKICQKLKKNWTDPIYGVEVTTVQMYHCAQFEAEKWNNVQYFDVNISVVVKNCMMKKDKWFQQRSKKYSNKKWRIYCFPQRDMLYIL